MHLRLLLVGLLPSKLERHIWERRVMLTHTATIFLLRWAVATRMVSPSSNFANEGSIRVLGTTCPIAIIHSHKMLEEALARTLKHREKLIAANCVTNKEKVDEALRCALTTLTAGSGNPCTVQDADMAVALTYIKDRVNVPRDMSIWAARRLRTALAETAAPVGPVKAPPIPFEDR